MLCKLKGALILCLILCLGLCACGQEEAITTTAEPVINLILAVDEETIAYGTICDDGSWRECEEFISDEINFYFAEDGCFQQTIRDGKVVNQVTDILVLTEEGDYLAPSEELSAIFEQAAAHTDQPIASLALLHSGGYYYPVLELEGGERILCRMEDGTLRELYRYPQGAIAGLAGSTR